MRKLTTCLLFPAVVTAAHAGPGPIGPTGPDAFGHTGNDLAFNLRDIQATGTVLVFTDDSSVNVPIGFAFDFYGASFNSLFVVSNGFLSFTNSGTFCCDGEPLPGSGPENMIAAAWNDFDPTEGGQVLVQTLGTAPNREFVVGFYDVQHNLDFISPPTQNTLEMILHEGSNAIEFQYQTLIQHGDVGIGQFGQPISIGIQDATLTDGIQVAFYPGFPQNDTVVLSQQGYLIQAASVPCPWDCGDDNGVVDTVDFLALLAEWGQVGTACDFNGGGVDTVDFLKLLAAWGACP